MDSMSRSVMLADGRPFEALKTASMLAISTFWKTFRFSKFQRGWCRHYHLVSFGLRTENQKKRKILTET